MLTNIFISTCLGLVFACQKPTTASFPADLVIACSYHQGFSGYTKTYLLSASRSAAQKHELAKTARIILLSDIQMKELYVIFEKNQFPTIRTYMQPISDRGGTTIEMRSVRDSKRIVKADAYNSFIEKNDGEYFRNCVQAIEQHLPANPTIFEDR